LPHGSRFDPAACGSVLLLDGLEPGPLRCGHDAGSVLERFPQGREFLEQCRDRTVRHGSPKGDSLPDGDAAVADTFVLVQDSVPAVLRGRSDRSDQKQERQEQAFQGNASSHRQDKISIFSLPLDSDD
jgi:hypothetical protein